MGKIIELKPIVKEELADLFLSMAMKDDDPQNAEKAFCEFHRRYSNYIYSIVKRACKPWKMYGEELIKSVHNNTLLIVYEKADRFLFIENAPIERQERRLKAWLGTVALNEMRCILRKTRDDKMTYLDDISGFDEEAHQDANIESKEIQLAEKALNILPERERDILVTYLMYMDGNKQQPEEENKRLADTWGILPDNIRQIRKRALAKTKSFLETHIKS